MGMKSYRTLISFIAYCIQHPEERFWQALKNWSGYECVFVGKCNPPYQKWEIQYDTFNWEGKRHDD